MLSRLCLLRSTAQRRLQQGCFAVSHVARSYGSKSKIDDTKTKQLMDDIRKLEHKLDAHKKSLQPSAVKFDDKDIVAIYEELSAAPPTRSKIERDYLEKLRVKFLDTRSTSGQLEDKSTLTAALPSPTPSETLSQTNVDGDLPISQHPQQNALVLDDFEQLIYANALAKRPREAEQALTLMKDYNLQPSTKCFNHLMDAYANVKDVESVIATFKRMKEEGLKADIYTYGTLIKTFVQSSRLEDAFVIFRKMKTANMIPSQPIFSMLLSGCITMQDIDRAWRVFDEMRLAYHQPDEVSFTLMLHACAERGEVERALNLFEDMTSQHLYPTDVTFNVLINACAKRSDYFDEAFSLLQQMQENGFKPDRITYNTLLSACARKKHLALAREIYRSMLQDTDVSPDQYTYANFFWCYASFNPRPAIENQAAEDAPVKQEQDEESNSLVSHSILFPQLPDRRSKVVAEAKAVFHYMLQQHIPVNTPLLNAYISTHISQKQDRECLQLYEQFDDMKVQRDGYTFLSMLQFCYNKRDASLAWKVWEDYQDFLEKRAAMFLPSDDPLQAKRIANDRTYAQHREGWSLPQQRALTLLMANTLAKTNDLQHSLSLLVTHFKKGGPLASLAIKYEDVKTIHNKCIQLEDMDAKQELMSLYAPRRPRLAPAKYRRVNM